MNERAVLLGKTKGLVGVLTEPTRTFAAKNYPAIILLNAGLVHRVGPNRIYVQIARRLAASGFPALRFDLAGIGDSGNRTDDLSLKEGAINDVKEAMNFLACEQIARHFILVGICSGANNSLRAAQNDPRVIGAVPIEPYHFSTTGYHLYLYSRRLLNPKCWRRLLTMKSDFWRLLRNYKIRKENWPKANGRSGQVGAEGRASFKTQIVSEIQDLLSRGVSLHFVYCVDSPSYYNHYLPLRQKTASSKQFQVTLFANTDHTFTLVSSQASLVNSIHDWVKAVAQAPSLPHRM